MSYEQDLQGYFNYIQGIQFPAIVGQMDNILLLKIVSMLSEPLGIGNYEDEYAEYLDYLDSKYRWSSDSERNFLLFRILTILSKAGNSQYLGTWNALTNTPALSSLTDLKLGDWFLVSTAGSYNNINWGLYDTVKWNGTTWDRIPYPATNTTSISSDEVKETSVTLTLSSDYIIESGSSVRFYYLNPNGSNKTVTFPAASSCPNTKYSVVNIGESGSLSFYIRGTAVGLDISPGNYVACHSANNDWNFFVNKL